MNPIGGPSFFQYQPPSTSSNFPLSQQEIDMLYNSIYAPLKDWYHILQASGSSSQIVEILQNVNQLLSTISPQNPYYQNLENLSQNLSGILNYLNSSPPDVNDAKNLVSQIMTPGNQNLGDILSDWQAQGGKYDVTEAAMLELADADITSGDINSASSMLTNLINILKSQGKDTQLLESALEFLQNPETVPIGQGMILRALQQLNP